MLHCDRPGPVRPPRAVALWARPDRADAVAAAAQAGAWLGQRQVAVLPAAQLAAADLVLVFGGDGAVVAAARTAAPHGVPVLGVNFGTFGFLAEIAADQLLPALARIVDGDYEVASRLMLAAHVDGGQEELLAANDVAVKATEPGRVLELRVRLGSELIAEFPADGLILATATGSTAYNLSAGGPVLMPELPAIVMTPICPHTLATRPLVLSADAQLTIEVVEAPRMSLVAVVSVDGQIHRELRPGGLLLVTRSQTCVRLARLSGGAFFDSLRGKLGWGQPK